MSDLFTYHAQQRAQAGIERSATTAGQQWHNDAVDALANYLDHHQTMFVDDLWPHLPTQPDGKQSGRALGAVIRHAARQGWITKQHATNGQPQDIVCRPSTRSNLSPKPVWLSTLYRSETP